MIFGKNIVIFSTMDFYDLPTRKQRIALKLSEKNRVIYFEPPLTYFSFFLTKKQKKINREKVDNNLIVIKLPYILPFGLRSFFINRLNSFILGIFVRREFKRLDFKNYILWLYLIDFPELYRNLNPELIVYDCVDDHSSYKGLRSKKFVRKCEEDVARISKVIFATTEELANKLKKYNPYVYVVSNGVDYDFFVSHKDRDINDLNLIKKPIIGYFGAIKEWFDLDAVIFAANYYKEASFVIVGPYNEEIRKKVSNVKNIYLLGRKPYDLAPSYISSFAVCLIPFKINELTLNVSPLKLYEYFSFGKAVVTIPIIELLKYSNLLYFYSSKEEIIPAIKKAFNEDDISLKEERKLVALQNSWNAKFDFMFEKVYPAKAGIQNHLRGL